MPALTATTHTAHNAQSLIPPAAFTLSPGGSWSGTVNSGGTAPTENATPLGSGSIQKAIGNFDQPLMLYLTADLVVTVVCDTAEAAWIQEVQFYLEGNTVTVPAAKQTLSASTGAVGYAATLKFSGFAQDGDANLYAYIRPVNGLERRIGPIAITCVGTGVSPITRALRYVDFTLGADTNAGTSAGAGNAWKTLNKALISAPAGAIVNCATGTYLEDSNAGTTQLNTRPITVQPSSGVLGDVVISRTSRFSPEWRWQPKAQNVIFNKMQLEAGNIVQVYGSATAKFVWLNSKIADTINGQSGAAHGIFNGSGSGTGGASEISALNFLRDSDGQYHALINTAYTYPQITTQGLLVGATLNTACDGVQVETAQPWGAAMIASTADKRGNFYIRYHFEDPLTVASASFVSGRTVIQWTGGTTDTSLSAGQVDPTGRVRFLTGSLAGVGSDASGAFPYVPGEILGYTFYAHDSVNHTTTLQSNFGDLTGSIHAGDTAWVAQILHPDMGQFGQRTTSQPNYDNVMFHRCLFTANIMQNMFFQPASFTGAGTVTTVGTAATFSGAHGLQLNDFVFLNAGAQAKQTRRVVAIVDSTHVTLASAFTVNQTGVAWVQGKSINNSAWQLCVWFPDAVYPTDNTDQGQWQHGQSNVVMRQCTYRHQPLFFRTNTGGFSLEGCAAYDDIIESLTSDVSPGFPPSGANGITFTNLHLQSGTIRGTNSEVAVATFDGTHKPTSGVAITTTPKLKWDVYGASLFNDGTDLVGAVKR